MIVRRIFAMGIVALALFGVMSPAQSRGIGAEAGYGRAQGAWGTELGGGYALDLGSFTLTPGAGVFIKDGDTDLYGRIEAAFHLPASASIGAGLRFADDTRPYVILAMPLLPKLAVVGNMGPKYYAIGLTLGY